MLQMLALLPYDLLHNILKFQEPKEIIALYESLVLEDVIQEMIKHTNFIVECKVVLSNKELNWFQTKNINVKLLEEYKIDERGDEYWYKNGKLHRDNDLPAIIFSNGYQGWYKNGKLHRDNDLPAAISSDGDHYWYQNGNLHRDNDLPATIYSNGEQCWYKNGERHRDNDLPAVIQINGTQRWYKNHKLHRDNDLPAVIYEDGTQKWYKNGIKYSPI
jgi:antitoxin component YwqK of YwqJK toxin-antitoxin module